MSKRTIFIGDVHGCLVELEELLAKVAPTEYDRVIFLGDIIHKGPSSAEVVRLIHSRGYECVCGNHEYSYRRRFMELPRHRELRTSLSESEHAWLLDLPAFIEEENFIAVHGGLIPGIPPQESDLPLLCKIRTWDGVGEDLNHPEHPAWHALYSGSKPVFYGHWAQQGLRIGERTFGLDDGCCYGGSLSAYILETGELVQAQAKNTYQTIE